MGKQLCISLNISNKAPFTWGNGCSTAEEHTPVKQNFWGRGFEPCRVLGFFLLFSIQSSVHHLIQVPNRGATLPIFL